MSVASWTYHALTVKSAFQLGMQSPTSYKEYGAQEAELRRRLWYGVVNQDRSGLSLSLVSHVADLSQRVLCMCLGRPCLIPAQYVRTPRLSDPRVVDRSSSVLHNQQFETLIYYQSLTYV